MWLGSDWKSDPCVRLFLLLPAPSGADGPTEKKEGASSVLGAAKIGGGGGVSIHFLTGLEPPTSSAGQCTACWDLYSFPRRGEVGRELEFWDM